LVNELYDSYTCSNKCPNARLIQWRTRTTE